MAYYQPCKNCAVDVDTCKRRADISSAISGLSVTSIKFRCADRASLFRPGQRVTFRWSHVAHNQIAMDDFSPDVHHLEFSGTVVKETKSRLRFTVKVDRDQACEGFSPAEVFRNDSLVINVRPSCMAATSEPDRILCPSCLAQRGDDIQSMCQGYLGGFLETHHPEGCLVSKADLKRLCD